MTPAELDVEIALAILGGTSDGPTGTFHFFDKVISYAVTDARPGTRIKATLSLRDGPKLSAQTSCSVWTFAELRTTAIAWGIGMVLVLAANRAKRGGTERL